MSDSDRRDRPDAEQVPVVEGLVRIGPERGPAVAEPRDDAARPNEPSVGDLMDREFIAVHRAQPLASIAGALLTMPHPCAIVVDEKQRCVGLMRVADALRALVYYLPAFDMRLPVRTNAQADVALLLANGPVVGQVTVPMPRTVTANAPASTAAAWMAFHELEWLPVVAPDGTPVGLLSALALLRAEAVRDGRLVVQGVVRPPVAPRLLN
ncbi:MAG TPA: CBS domain-containing protein [Sandaracinaceae bacterium]